LTAYEKKKKKTRKEKKKKCGKTKRETMRKINILYLFCIIATSYTEIVSKKFNCIIV